ncbi:MAG: flagellar hook-length control protein FliK [Phycisphaerales bacterium]|nr:flagellar hook-length control protein FliK [Phycisphaerales bacterium]
MKPLQATSNSANPLATATGASSLTAQANAQKLRTHAQHKRGGVASFMDQLSERRSEPRSGRGIGPPTADRPHANGDRGASKLEEASRETGAAEDGPSSRAANDSKQPQRDGQSAQGPATTSQDQSEPTFEQEVVSVILAGVDPVLRLKPAAQARVARTVAGNTQAARNSIEVEPGQQSAATPEPAQSDPAGASSPEELSPPPRRERADIESSAAHTKSRQQPDGQSSEPKPASPAQPTQSNHSKADAAATAAANAVQAPIRAGEQRLSLVPTLTAVPVGSMGPVPRSAAGLPPREGNAPAQVADQVEHGLQVAMRDLPSPGGERLVTLRLFPSALGSMRIAMHVKGETVSVRFQVGSAKAKAAVGKAIDDLCASITRQGLRVESMLIEEDSALAAPDRPADDRSPRSDGLAAGEAAGKEIAIQPTAPHGQDGPRAGDGTGRTPSVPEVDSEGGVLQVLTFRLDAVA